MKRLALGTVAAVAIALSVARPGARAQTVASRRQPSAQTTPTFGDSALDARTAAVASTLRCPVCQGESIEASPSELAAEMRAVVRERLRAGDSPDAVRAYFVSKYGEWILLEPRMTGLNILLYVLPVVLVVGGVILVVVLVRRWTTPKASTQ
jgi:cytochrome c-type biogenesis protein CcmH/NrfF